MTLKTLMKKAYIVIIDREEDLNMKMKEQLIHTIIKSVEKREPLLANFKFKLYQRKWGKYRLIFPIN